MEGVSASGLAKPLVDDAIVLVAQGLLGRLRCHAHVLRAWPMSGVYAIVPYCLASLRESREISLSVLSSKASDHRVPLVTGVNGTLMARQS
jgi:hypothetical protein